MKHKIGFDTGLYAVFSAEVAYLAEYTINL